jgi:hypothetical protein
MLVLEEPVVLEGDVKAAISLMAQSVVLKQKEVEAAQKTVVHAALVLSGYGPELIDSVTLSLEGDTITLLPKAVPAVHPNLQEE